MKGADATEAARVASRVAPAADAEGAVTDTVKGDAKGVVKGEAQRVAREALARGVLQDTEVDEEHRMGQRVGVVA